MLPSARGARQAHRFAGLAPGKRPGMSDVHVVPNGDAWACEVAGDKRESFDTQDEAITRGRELAEQEQAELVIHGKGGRIREKDSHGHDPRDIPG